MNERTRLFLTAALAFTAGLIIYLQGTAPSVVEADTAELQSLALVGGLAHPTGYPTFVMLGRLFALLPFSDPAFRINFMSSFIGALTLGLIVILLRALGLSLRAAFAGALLYGFTYTFWDSALRAGTYTLAVCLAVLALWRTIVAFRSGQRRDMALAGFLLGLMLTGHMAFSLPAAALGLALAGRVVAARERVVTGLLLLAGAFVLGLTPYLYLFWADAQSYPINYLKLLDTCVDPIHHHNPVLDTPWKRFAWTLFGRNEFPTPPPIKFDGGLFIKRLGHSAATLFLFELGPLALPFMVAGFVRRVRKDQGLALVLAAALASSLLIPGLLNTGFMLGVFLIPCTLLCSLLVADGLAGALDWFAERPRYGRLGAATLAILAPVLIALPPNAIRVYSYDHPLGPKRNIQVPQHDSRQLRSLIPTMHDYWGPRRFGEQAMAVIPPDALVAADWTPMTILYYFRYVEGRRPDLTILPPKPGILQYWQEVHSLAGHPFVFVGRTDQTAPYLANADSLELAWHQWIYVVRSPLPGLAPN